MAKKKPNANQFLDDNQSELNLKHKAKAAASTQSGLDNARSYFAEKFGLNPDNLYKEGCINLSTLVSYANIKDADSAVKSNKLGPKTVPGNQSLWGAITANLGPIDGALMDFKEAFGRENNAVAVFGLPYSYLPAVDPYGRVYKDLFGVRPEENYIYRGGDLIGSILLDNNSKFFSAFIKVGMICQAKGSSLMDKILKGAGDAAKAAEDTVKDTSKSDLEKKAAELKKKVGNLAKEVEDHVRSGKIVGYVGNEAANEYSKVLRQLEEGKKKVDGAVDKARDKDTSIVTSFTLSYYVQNELAADLGKTGDGLYQNGAVVPFAHFVYNALLRVLNNHNSLGSAYYKLCKSYIQNIFKSGSNLPFYKFICTEESIVNETIQNQVGDSFIKGLIDKSSDISREISFVSGGANAADIAKTFASDVAGALGANGEDKGALGSLAGALASGFKSMTDFAVGGAEAIFGKDLVDMVLKGNSLIYPRVWKGSSVETMASLQMRFYSPYGDFASIFQSVIVPLTILMGIALPRQVYPSFISYPFAMSVDVPGLFTSNMAIVTNIAIKRGGRYDAWNNASLMRGVDVTLDVTPLKPLMGLPEEGGATVSNTIYGNKNTKGDKTFANYLKSMAGDFSITDSEMIKAAEGHAKEAIKNAISSLGSNITFGLSKDIPNFFANINDNLTFKASTDNTKK